MTERERREAIRRQRSNCGWCAANIGLDAYVVARPAGPIAFCDTCRDRYENPDLHPYLRACLRHQGR